MIKNKMNKYLIIITYSLMTFLWSSMAFSAQKEQVVCNDIKIIGNLRPELNDNEERLICGDPNTSDAVGDSWKHVPRSQSEFHLKVFLQSRGYFNPVLKRTGKESGLIVELGNPTIVKSIQGEGIPKELDLSKKRKIVGEKLTPALLNELEKWINGRLQSFGYGCPDIETYANPDTGEVFVYVDSGERQKIISVTDESVAGITHRALDRYSAFHVGDYFNGDNLTITERRIKSSGILQGANFYHTCTKDGIEVNRVGIEGPPRLVRVGVGANTEGILILKASWKNTRLWSNASMFDISTYLTTQEQRVSGSMDLYVLGGSRSYLHPEVIVAREKERPYEISEVKASFHYGTSFDNPSLGFKFRTGPTIEYVDTISGSGPDDSFFLSLETDMTLRSHLHEYYSASPRTGYMLNFHSFLNSHNIESRVDAQRFSLNGQMIYNFKDFDIPLLVFAMRGGYSTIYSPTHPGPNSQLPPNFLYYLGGPTNVRGFSRKSLTYNGDGGMTMGYLGSELRLVDNPIPFNIQPFIFYDIGALGGETATLNSPYYFSPGVGVRWDSPIGAVRGTAAKGYTQNSDEANVQFYISLGEEF